MKGRQHIWLRPQKKQKIQTTVVVFWGTHTSCQVLLVLQDHARVEFRLPRSHTDHTQKGPQNDELLPIEDLKDRNLRSLLSVSCTCHLFQSIFDMICFTTQ